jgi:glycine cleavage system protein P-like pyridoxal-binding family
MSQPLLVVARNAARLDKFEQPSLQSAINLKDFLKEIGEYDEVSILQLGSPEGRSGEWVALKEIDC